MKTINEWMDRYIKGNCSRRDLLNQMGLFSYQWARKYPFLGDDGAADFYLTLQPRLEHLLEKYDHCEGPFAPFFGACLKRHSLRFMNKKSWDKRRQKMYQYNFPEKDFCLGEHYRSYGIDFCAWIKQVQNKLDTLAPRIRKITLRRILCLLLYHAFQVPDHWVEPLSSLTGIPCEEFLELLKEIREYSNNKQERWKETEASLSRMFSNLKTHEIYIKGLDNSYHQNEALRKIQFYRNRVEGSRKKLKQLTLTTSQRKISQMLKMPTGTVNSAVHYAKKFLPAIPEGSMTF